MTDQMADQIADQVAGRPGHGVTRLWRSGAPLRTAWIRQVLGARLAAFLRDPLHRTGNALVANSALTALLGIAFWAAAARLYSRVDVGLSSTAISAMMMLSGFAQLNLMSAMVRFLPTSGRGAWKLVSSAYLLAAVLSAVAAGVFVIGVRVWTPQLGGLLLSWRMGLWFTASTAAWSVFVLQDSIVTGLGRPVWVPVENGVHSVAKLALVVLLAAAWPAQGVLMSWTLAVLVASIPLNAYLFLRILPRHVRAAREQDGPPPLRQLARFVIGDYAGAACWIGATTAPAQLVLRQRGAAQAASFSMAWIVSYTLFLLASAIGQGLVVQGALDPARRDLHRAQAYRHTFGLLVPAVVVTVAGAPLILGVFGARYAAQGSAELRLLALSALPNAVVALAMSELRVRRRVLAIFWVMAGTCVLVLGLSILLLPRVGISGIGLAWLIAQTVIAVATLVGRHRLLGPDDDEVGAARGAPGAGPVASQVPSPPVAGAGLEPATAQQTRTAPECPRAPA